MRLIKVLVVDDSAVIRSVLTHSLSENSDITVIGGAKDPYEARELIIAHRPDVIILDIEMPRMDGLTFLKKLQVHYPVPVIMCSGVAPSNSRVALDAIEAGAIDVVPKPDHGGRDQIRRLGDELAEKIRAAAVAMPPPPEIPASATAAPRTFRSAGLDSSRYLVAIGASTGGTEAIKRLLERVPADFPATVIVQHMPEGFTRAFAERLNQYSAMTVTEAVDGDALKPGHAFVARGGVQMAITGSAGHWRITLGTDEPVNRHCPSVDVLFDSVIRRVGGRAIGVLLTGMGADGAKGLLAMRKGGAVTVAQEQRSCVVFGMPKVAIELGAAEHVAPPGEIPALVLSAVHRRDASRARNRTSRAQNSPI